MLVTIVVPCRNERGHVSEFVESLVRQDLGAFSIEAIIADGMSDDGTDQELARLAALYPWLHVIDNPARIVSTGLNSAIRIAQGEVIIRMDVHASYPPDYVRQCVETLRETHAQNVGGRSIALGETYTGCAVAAAFHSPLSTGGALWHNTHDGPVDTVPFGCWRKQTLLDLGLFDESLVRNQDDELNLRTVRSGGVIWQSSRIYSWYTPRSAFKSFFKQQFQYGFWKVAVIRKHRLPASWRHLVPALFVLANLALPSAFAFLAAVGHRGLAELALFLWLFQAGAYLLSLLIASVITAARSRWALLPILPAVFTTYHVAYGLGFVLGLLNWVRFGRGERQSADLFTGLSR